MLEQGQNSKSPMTLLLLIAILVIATLVMISNYFLRPGIELDLKQKVMTTLFQHKVFDAAIKVEGRDVTIIGITTDSQESKKVETEIQNITGVNQVDNKLLIKNQTIE